MSLASSCLDNVHEILRIKVQPGSEQQLLRTFKKAPEVRAAYISLGEYDIIAFLGIEDLQKLNHFVAENVEETTCVVDNRTTLVKSGGTHFR